MTSNEFRRKMEADLRTAFPGLTIEVGAGEIAMDEGSPILMYAVDLWAAPVNQFDVDKAEKVIARSMQEAGMTIYVGDRGGFLTGNGNTLYISRMGDLTSPQSLIFADGARNGNFVTDGKGGAFIHHFDGDEEKMIPLREAIAADFH